MGSLRVLQIGAVLLPEDYDLPLLKYANPSGVPPIHQDNAVALWKRHCKPVGQAERHHGKAGSPALFDGLSSLETLRMHCLRFNTIPSSLFSLVALKQLHLGGGRLVHELPPELGDLGALRELRLEHFPLVQHLPNALSALTALTSLAIESLSKLSELSFRPSWEKMQDLSVTECGLLPPLRGALGVLTSLKHLRLGCNLLDALDVGPLSHLTSFEVTACSHGSGNKTLPQSLSMLPSLQRIKAANCCLGEVPHYLSQLTGLESLDLDAPDTVPSRRRSRRLLYVLPPESCKLLPPCEKRKLQSMRNEIKAFRTCTTSWLPVSLECLRSLQHLSLSGFQGRSLPSRLSELKELTSMHLGCCHELESLGQGLASLPALRLLKLWWCPCLRAIPCADQTFPALQGVLVEGCPLTQGLNSPFRRKKGVVVQEGLPHPAQAAVEDGHEEIVIRSLERLGF